MTLFLETAVDTTSLHTPDRLISTGRKGYRLKFTANFPRLHDPRWFKELQFARIQAGDASTEVKWAWFSSARNQLPQQFVQRVYQGLGEASIFIYDFSKYVEEIDTALLESGVPKDLLQQPKVTNVIHQIAVDNLLSETPLQEIGYIYEVVTEETFPYTPKQIRSELTSKTGNFIQNPLEFASNLAPAFQELRDRQASEALGQYVLSKRYLGEDEAQIQQMMLALGPKRILDDGHRNSANLVCQVRVVVSQKLTEGLALMGITPLQPFGCTEILPDSAALDHMQMADLAASYAKELYERAGRNASALRSSFKCVLLNSQLVTS